MRHTVDYLYSLYDALISIHVPNDKARAVVDAMERDMTTTLATKSDLDLLRSEFRQELTLVRKDLDGVRKDIDTLAIAFHKDLELLSTTMTVRLGSMLIVGLGVLFAALKLS